MRELLLLLSRIRDSAVRWFARIFIVPHFLVGVGLALYLVFQMTAVRYGSTTTATIQQVESGTSGKSTSYTAHYVFNVNGMDYEDQEDIAESKYRQWSPPATTGLERTTPAFTTPVRYFVLGPFHTSSLPEGGSASKNIGFLAVWVVLWNGIVGIFVYILWIAPYREWRRVRRSRRVAA